MKLASSKSLSAEGSITCCVQMLFLFVFSDFWLYILWGLLTYKFMPLNHKKSYRNFFLFFLQIKFVFFDLQWPNTICCMYTALISRFSFFVFFFFFVSQILLCPRLHHHQIRGWDQRAPCLVSCFCIYRSTVLKIIELILVQIKKINYTFDIFKLPISVNYCLQVTHNNKLQFTGKHIKTPNIQ